MPKYFYENYKGDKKANDKTARTIHEYKQTAAAAVV
jgi:hypothetical protein